MSDSRRKAPKGVKFEDTRSGSSRASTIGGSSTSSGHSGSQYTPEYNIGALEESLRTTVRQLDDWKKRALDSEASHRKSEDASKARIKALEHQYTTLTESLGDTEKQLRDSNKENETLRRETEALKKENAKLQKKVEKYENRSEPSSPDSGKLRRSESKKSKDPEGDRLKERLNRNSETPSDTNSSKPPSSSRSKHSSSRRLSVSSSERAPYLEEWGPSGPPAAPIAHPASSSRRPPSAYIMTNMPMPVVTSTMQSPVYATPRSTAMPPMRPTVEYTTYPHPHEGYQIPQLPRR